MAKNSKAVSTARQFTNMQGDNTAEQIKGWLWVA